MCTQKCTSTLDNFNSLPLKNYKICIHVFAFVFNNLFHRLKRAIYSHVYSIYASSLLVILFRVSVPRSSLLSPHRFKPHRRSSFDPTDAMSLSSHCLAGWESSKPTVIPMPSSLDLRTSLHKSRTTLVSAQSPLFIT